MFPLFDPVDGAKREALRAYDDLTAALLTRRGISTAEEAEAFLSPSYDAHIGDPMQIRDMPKAVGRIQDALAAGERVAVWSDYDCDGIPGGVVLHDFFKKAGANFINYIPHRHEEGFGLNEQGLQKLEADGVSLVITVDCGIADIAAVEFANSIGLDVIITDHHLPVMEALNGELKQHLPPAFAVVDAKQEGETYPFKDFCGGGMAWKLICAMLSEGSMFPGRDNFKEGWEKWLLDMAGLSTIADMVPLTGENRVIARYGLLVMRKSPRIGFQALCKAARVNQRYLTEDDVGFMIAPRVNAASRMGDAMDAFRLFTTESEAEADELAKKLEAINRSRRAAGAAVTKRVHERLEERKTRDAIPDVIVMGDPEWRPGLLGLVANSIAEEYQRPVFLWGREGSNTLKGSCRAGRPDVHLLELMQAAPDTFIEFGGHRASGGFSVQEDAIHFLEAKLNDAYASLSFLEHDEADYADAELALSEATTQFLTKLERLAPFGMGNPKPAFVMRDVHIKEVAWFGKAGEHLRLRLDSNNLDFTMHNLEAISFYAKRELGKACDSLSSGTTATILGTLERDQFSRGQPVRVRIAAIK
ncbi:MAG: single-stranded-DNA-specific exonuclease RecJ [Candidatus Pacebacteria bacterium]|nr:single-stranded-DNA-specific exonuclease RecJ [Candidatus Paceibacterota bacterium]